MPTLDNKLLSPLKLLILLQGYTLKNALKGDIEFQIIEDSRRPMGRLKSSR